MDLSHEDQLRLNVLVRNVEAIRIDEHNMTVCGLSDENEAQISLSPNCAADRYLRLVREFLSNTALGSPGGYPVFLKRWTRMGEIKSTCLAELLMLGEPEAVTAVTRSAALTLALAHKAWWAAPTSDHARRLLQQSCVIESDLGRELAAFLIEHLPFETEAQAIIESVQLILQGDLIDAASRDKLWDKGAKKSAYRIGFLNTLPHNLPVDVNPRSDRDQHSKVLTPLAEQGNPLATLLLLVFDKIGQAFIQTAEAALRRPTDQDTVVSLVDTIGHYFAAARCMDNPSRDMDEISDHAKALFDHALKGQSDQTDLVELIKTVPKLESDILSILILACVGDPVVTPVFAQTDAVGTLMRRKLEPVTTPIFAQLKNLQWSK